MDALLDHEASGPLYLRLPEIAAIVAQAIHKGGNQDYSLHAWVVMPNYVHLLISPRANVSVLLRRLKGGTAHQANQILLRKGPFWQHESYDRLVRDDREFDRIENYIVQNPVKAGLAASSNSYRWSSAWEGSAC